MQTFPPLMNFAWTTIWSADERKCLPVEKHLGQAGLEAVKERFGDGEVAGLGGVLGHYSGPCNENIKIGALALSPSPYCALFQDLANVKVSWANVKGCGFAPTLNTLLST